MPLHVCVIFTLMMAHSAFIKPLCAVFRMLSKRNCSASVLIPSDKIRSQNKPKNNSNSNKNDNDYSNETNDNVSNNDNNDNDIKNNENYGKNKSSHTSSEVISFQSDHTSLKFDVLSVVRHFVGWLIVTYVLRYHTLSHPFLLSDNR